ncbi:MAG TPA: calcium-binding protein [Actinomycetota bacterium]|nr:calcium-binding protein [Actinomycetota bacterium]
MKALGLATIAPLWITACIGMAVAEAGNETCGGKQATMVGTDRADLMFGSQADEVFVGRGGRDVMHGGGGHDLICGNEGSDRLVGGAGSDRLWGGGGRDWLELARVDGGATIYLETLNGTWGSSRAPGAGRDRLFGIENVLGTKFGDRIVGSATRNELVGIGGRDKLRGRDGDDLLRGGYNRDSGWGGHGRDRCRSIETRTGCEH